MTDKPIEERGTRSRAGWFEAANIHGFYPTDEELHTGWSKWLSVNRAVILQSPDDTKYQKNLRRLLIADCERGACVCRKTQKRAGGTYILGTDEDGQGFRHQTPERTETEYLIEASDYLSWLSRQGLFPCRHVTAWDVAVNNPVPTQNTAVPVPVVAASKHTTKRRNWRDVALPYVVDIFKAGNFTTAKALYLAIEKKAGTDSPFERGTGDNRAKLVVRELSEPVSLKTIQNAWADIKALR